MLTVRRVVTSRSGGASAPPYASFNLATHVGDEPSAVHANRLRLASAIGLGPDRLVWMEQAHGAAVAVVDDPRPEPVAGTDALVTVRPDLALVVLVADCVPILLADAAAGVVAAVHAGRAGAAAGVLPAALAAMVRLGARPAGVDALLGPAVCGPCYEVPTALRTEVEAVLPGSAAASRRSTAALDLRAGLARQLTSLGVPKIVLDPRCTAEDPELFSHRRDGRTGRQAGVIWIEP